MSEIREQEGAAAGPRDPVTSHPVTGVKKVFEWLPWEKALIWGLFILTVYALRHFFFIIFVTFIVTYIMRSSVRRISRFVLPARENIWLERVLSFAGFAVLLSSLYATGNYLGPALYRQGEALVKRVGTLEPEKELNNFIQRTVGVVLFRRRYGSIDDGRYREKFEQFQAEQGPGSVQFESFPELMTGLERQFLEDETQRIKEEVQQKLGSNDKSFESWFLREKAPAILERDREELIAERKSPYETIRRELKPDLPPFEEYLQTPEFEQALQRIVLLRAFADVKTRTSLRAEWENYVAEAAVSLLKSSPEYEQRFQEFYERARKVEGPTLVFPEGKPLYDYAKYVELKEAHLHGREAFAAALKDITPDTEEGRLRQAHEAFELSETRNLTSEWRKTDAYQRAQEVVTEYVQAGLKSLGGWVQQTIGYLLTLPVQLSLALLLSFFITLDVPRLRRGILSLRESRAKDFFDEIAPGLYNFGRLIGRAFQAQGVIALFNTLLTFVAIRFLHIQNEIVLCAVVFVCSFIPVLGVVLSSAPIAVMAIVQPGGSIILALQAVAAILVIHFIETSLLNPKILGEMLHLHPVLVLAVLAIGEHFFGIWGLLLAVPVTVFIIRSVILDEEIPGLIEDDPLPKMENPHLVAAIARVARTEPTAAVETTKAKEKDSVGASQ